MKVPLSFYVGFARKKSFAVHGIKTYDLLISIFFYQPFSLEFAFYDQSLFSSALGELSRGHKNYCRSHLTRAFASN